MPLIKKMMMLALVLLTLVGCGQPKKEETKEPAKEATNTNKTLKVFSWGEYIDKTVITDFEKEYGVKVVYETFDSNESMYTKLSSGAKFDILVPSDYMIQRLIAEDMLQKIDQTKIPNISHLLESTLNKKYDPKMEYSIPFFWGNVGILYNKKTVDPALVEKKGWEIFKDPKYSGKIFFYDSERDAFMVALKALGFSANTENPDELKKAYEWLLELNKTMNPVYADDSIIDAMVNSNKDIANIYSGDASYIMSENENMAYFVPKEGSNIWQDAMVIPKNAENPELAHQWMDYMLRPEVAKKNTLEVGYSSPVKEVFDEMVGADGDYAEINAYKVEIQPKDEEFFYNPKVKEIISEYWTKVKGTK